MTIYSLDILLFLFRTSLLFHVQARLYSNIRMPIYIFFQECLLFPGTVQCWNSQSKKIFLSGLSSFIRFSWEFQSWEKSGKIFLLWLHPFILSGDISPLISSSILGTYRPGEFIFQCPIFLPFHTVHGVLKARILKWFAIPFSSGPHSVRPLHHDPSVWVALQAWLSFIELDRLWSM